MYRRFFVLALLCVLGLSACAPDPRREAEAYRIRTEADSQAALSAQELAALEYAQRIKEQDDAAAVAERQAAKSKVIQTAGNTVIALLAVCGIATGLGYSVAAVGAGIAAQRAAIFRATFIPLDHATRQYPALIQYAGRGRYALINPNDGSVTLCDTSNPADRQKVLNAGAVLLSGAIAEQARRSKDPRGFASLSAPVLPILTGDNDEE